MAARPSAFVCMAGYSAAFSPSRRSVSQNAARSGGNLPGALSRCCSAVISASGLSEIFTSFEIASSIAAPLGVFTMTSETPRLS